MKWKASYRMNVSKWHMMWLKACIKSFTLAARITSCFCSGLMGTSISIISCGNWVEHNNNNKTLATDASFDTDLDQRGHVRTWRRAIMFLLGCIFFFMWRFASVLHQSPMIKGRLQYAPIPLWGMSQPSTRPPPPPVFVATCLLLLCGKVFISPACEWVMTCQDLMMMCQCHFQRSAAGVLLHWLLRFATLCYATQAALGQHGLPQPMGKTQKACLL